MRVGQKAWHRKLAVTDDSKFRKSMFSEVAPPVPNQLVPADTCTSTLEEDMALAEVLAGADRAPSTRTIYRADFKRFTTWCAGRALCAKESTTCG